MMRGVRVPCRAHAGTPFRMRFLQVARAADARAQDQRGEPDRSAAAPLRVDV